MLVPQQFVDRCLSEAIAATRDDRRNLRRYPFLRPVTICSGDDSWSAICRDASRGGMGLVDGQPADPGRRITVKLPVRTGYLRLDSEVKWCLQVGEGCFLSGVSFRDVEFGASLSLLSEVIREEINRRVQQRFPFFRPIKICGESQARQPVFSRDISRGGMGLMHRWPITPGRTIVSVPDVDGENQEISLDIRWCTPAGQDWYLSGARFASVWLEEVPAKLM